MKLITTTLALFCATTLASRAAEWEAVATDLLKTGGLGYGGLCGVLVDHTSGEVFLNLSDLGIYHSKDAGATWQAATTEPFKGRTESPGCWTFDPTGRTRRMAAALVYGRSIALSDDRGKSFRFLDPRSEHIDWCALDWAAPEPTFVLALKHEQDGLLIASNDGGKTFRDVGKRYVSGWVFDAKTAVVAREKTDDSPEPTIQRTTDGGMTFAACGQFEPVGWGSSRTLPKWRDGTLYWLTRQGLIASTDQGSTWKVRSEVADGLYGPVMGKDPQHLFVLTTAGILESTDGGATWSAALAGPRALGELKGLTWLDYDPQHDILYLMKMTSDLYRLKRGD